jgi:hypothetical protein
MQCYTTLSPLIIETIILITVFDIKRRNLVLFLTNKTLNFSVCVGPIQFTHKTAGLKRQQRGPGVGHHSVERDKIGWHKWLTLCCASFEHRCYLEHDKCSLAWTTRGPVGSADVLCAILDLTHNLAISSTSVKFNLSIRLLLFLEDFNYYILCWGSSVGTGWKVWEWNPDEGEHFLFPQDRPGPLSLLYNGYHLFPGAKAAGTWCWPPAFF